MNFATARLDPRRHLTGILFVAVLHVALVYALVSGLAKRIVDVVRLPIETRVIEEVKTEPPPPPEIVLPALPEFEPPPPPFIPPPEVRIAQPPPRPPIAVVTRTPPPAPVVIAPAPPPAPTPAPAPPRRRRPRAVVAPPKPAPAPAPAPPVTAGVACSNFRTAMGDAAYPRQARRQGLARGDALIQFTLTSDGRVTDIKTLRASHPIFARSSMQVVAQFKCRGQGRDVVVIVPFGYTLE